MPARAFSGSRTQGTQEFADLATCMTINMACSVSQNLRLFEKLALKIVRLLPVYTNAISY